MKEEMQEIKEELSSKEQLLEEVGQRLKELSLREEISSEKLKLV